MLVRASQLTRSTAPHWMFDSNPISNYNVTGTGQVQYLRLTSYTVCWTVYFIPNLCCYYIESISCSVSYAGMIWGSCSHF